MTPDSLRILLAGLVDYAGLFPPAELSMADVAANYAAYLQSADAWALGRLIVPVTRLDGLSAAIATLGDVPRTPWRISALVGTDAADDAQRIKVWNASAAHGVVDTVELRATSPEAIVDVAHVFRDLTTYVEFPLTGDSTPYLDAIAHTGMRAKIRTGGVTPDAFPASEQIARFLRGCADRTLAFKATAGLHHPLRANYRLTYAANAPCGDMFGFLNVFVAAAFALEGMPQRDLIPLLEERDPSALQFDDGGIRWHHEEIDVQLLADMRTSFAIAFGSCSFREPIDDLHQLGML